MSITGLSQIHVTVTDLEAAVTFYRDVLGLSLLFEVPEQSMAFFQVGPVRLYLGQAESDDVDSRPLLYFEVDDIVAEFERLKSHNVDFEADPHVVHKTDESELWMAFFRTNEGQLNALTEERSVD